MATAINLARADSQADTGANIRQNQIVATMSMTTSEDYFDITAGGKPRILMFVSSVAWSYSHASGTLASKIPVAAGAPLTLEFPASMRLYVMSQATSANLLSQLLQ